MKILLINKYHYKKGGAEKAYFDTAKILKKQGNEVAFFSTKNPKNEPSKWENYFVENSDFENGKFSIWQKIRLTQRIIFNFEANKKLEKLILDFKPDIAHLHNIYHQLSPSIIHILKKHNIPVTLTLHDYKIISPNYNLFLRGKIWEKKSAWSCVCDKCVKDSYLKSLICVMENIIHKILGSYQKIDAYISPSKFLIEKFKEFGFSKEIVYVPNPVMPNYLIANKRGLENDPLVYCGRLSEEKGVDIAIKAMEFLEKKENLWIVGDGPEKNNLKEIAKKLNIESRVKFFGFKSGQELQEILNQAKAIIIPSIWHENMPYSIVESLAMGRIVIASNIGGIRDLISDKINGFLFSPGSVEDLAKKIKELKNYNLVQVANNAKNSTYQWSEDEYYKNLMFLYNSLLKK